MTDAPLTPQTEEKGLAAFLGTGSLYLKREDLHPYGSHKGRSIPVMIDMKAANGAKDFAISSSGNAALAAVRHVQKRNDEGSDLSLSVLIGERINPEKKTRLMAEIRDPRVTVTESKRPLQALFAKIKGESKESLRQSTDPLALLGYQKLAAELSRIPDLSAVFIGTSSGTCAQALAEYFNENDLPVSVHVVQTTSCPPIAKELGADADTAPSNEPSTADAIVDKVVYRRDAIVTALEKNKGAGWMVSNEEIDRAQKALAEKAGVTASPNGALGLAGLMKALAQGRTFPGAVACIITGQ